LPEREADYMVLNRDRNYQEFGLLLTMAFKVHDSMSDKHEEQDAIPGLCFLDGNMTKKEDSIHELLENSPTLST
jgi:hypothetical protein